MAGMAEGQVISAANEKHRAKRGRGVGGGRYQLSITELCQLTPVSVMADNESGNAQARRKVLRNGQESDERGHVNMFLGGGGGYSRRLAMQIFVVVLPK